MKHKIRLLSTVAALAVGLMSSFTFASTAHANLILSTGLVGGSGDVDNVIFNACGLGGGSGTTVQGCLNTSHTTLVDFTSNESLLIGEGGGQANISAGDGAFDQFTISFNNPTIGFEKLQFNLDAIADGTATFQAVDQFGTVFNFGSFDLDANGQNFFTLDSADNQVALSFSMLSTVGIQNITDLQQVRLGPASIGDAVPEPATLALFGLGLLGLGTVRRRLNG